MFFSYENMKDCKCEFQTSQNKIEYCLEMDKMVPGLVPLMSSIAQSSNWDYESYTDFSNIVKNVFSLYY
jgi:hypothetical protein